MGWLDGWMDGLDARVYVDSGVGCMDMDMEMGEE